MKNKSDRSLMVKQTGSARDGRHSNELIMVNTKYCNLRESKELKPHHFANVTLSTGNSKKSCKQKGFHSSFRLPSGQPKFSCYSKPITTYKQLINL